MKTTCKIIAVACIFSTLFMGCYSSGLIEPTGDERDKMYSDNIEYVILKDGTKHEFYTPPSITNDVIVGKTKHSVSIPLSDVATFYTGDEREQMYINKIRFITTKDSTKYEFATPPTMSSDNIIVGVALKETSLALSDVSQVYLTKFSYIKTGELLLLIALLCVSIYNGKGLLNVP
jgi:hypothetical protein